MDDFAIRVRNLSKEFRIGSEQAAYGTLRDSLADAARAPARRVRALLRGERATPSTTSFTALRDVSFDVRPGEVVGIIGHNGAGKSTLLKVLSRITEPTGGEIQLRGKIGSLLEVGTGFHPELTGRENIFLNGAILGMSRAEILRKFDEIVEFSEVAKFLDTPVKRYSSGMYLRLAFAVAAHLDPEILLVDEVLAVGDASFQRKCIGKMGEVAEGGRTVIFVSHNMSAVTTLCDRAILLKDGRVVADGPAEEVTAGYISAMLPRQSLSRELHDVPRRGNRGEAAKITYVEVQPTKGGHVGYREPLRVRVRVHARIALEELVVGVGINSADGRRLLTVESDESLTLSLAKGEEREFRLLIPRPGLPPGAYVMAVGARSGGNLSVDSVEEALAFEVAGGPDSLLLASRLGLGLRPESAWEVAEVSPPHVA